MGEALEVLAGDFLFDGAFLGGVDQGDAGALEAGAAEPAAVHAVGGEHGFVYGDELRGAAFVIVYGAFAGGLAEGPEPLEVACFPGGDALADAFVLAVEVLGAADKPGRHVVPVALEHRLGDVAQEGLVVRAQGDVLVGLDDPGGRLAFGHSEVVVGRHQAASEAAEEDAQLERGHVGRLGDEAVFVALAVEHEEVVLLAEGDAGLVKQAIVESDVFAFGLGGDFHYLERGELDVVGLGKGHDVCDEHRRAAGEASYGERAADDAADATRQREALLQGELGAAGVVSPVALLDEGGGGDVELDVAGEGLGVEHHEAVGADVEFQVNAFVDSEARHDSVLMVDVGAEGADTVGGKYMILHFYRFFAALRMTGWLRYRMTG